MSGLTCTSESCALYRLYFGITDSMSLVPAWVGAPVLKMTASPRRSFEYRHAHTRAMDLTSAMPIRARPRWMPCPRSNGAWRACSASVHTVRECHAVQCSAVQRSALQCVHAGRHVSRMACVACVRAHALMCVYPYVCGTRGSVCMRACVFACACACVRACVRACSHVLSSTCEQYVCQGFCLRRDFPNVDGATD